jgi:hypothetical protein
MLALALAVAAFLPSNGVLVPNESLAGIRLGDTPAHVRATIGSSYTVCRGCARPSWFYLRPKGFAGAESGLGVTFRDGRVVAVYTLGMPRGWHSSTGVAVGDDQSTLNRRYGGSLKLTTCIGFMAHSTRRSGTVTTYFTQESFVSGFALTVPSETVCR